MLKHASLRRFDDTWCKDRQYFGIIQIKWVKIYFLPLSSQSPPMKIPAIFSRRQGAKTNSCITMITQKLKQKMLKDTPISSQTRGTNTYKKTKLDYIFHNLRCKGTHNFRIKQIFSTKKLQVLHREGDRLSPPCFLLQIIIETPHRQRAWRITYHVPFGDFVFRIEGRESEIFYYNIYSIIYNIYIIYNRNDMSRWVG